MIQDAMLRRVERTAMACCGAMAVAALAIAKGSPGPAIAVLAGASSIVAAVTVEAVRVLVKKS
jgi:hypothetical protein